MAKETLITDLVAQEALDQLAELDRKMEGTLTLFKDCAREMAKGLTISVEVPGDIDKLRDVYQTQMQRAGQATQQLTQQLQQQQQVVANTTNTISRQLMEQERLNKATREAYKAEDDALTIARKTLGTRQQHYQKMAELTAQMRQNREEQSAWNKSLKEGDVTVEQYQGAMAQLLSSYDELKYESQQLARLLAVENKEAQAAEGSYEQLSQRLELMKKAYKQMNDETKKEDAGQTLEKGIQDLDAHLKDLAADMGEYQRNVGNYAVAAESAKAHLVELTNEIVNLTVAYENMSDEERKSAAGQELKDKIMELTEEAGKYKDAVMDVKDSIKGSASDTRWLDTMTESGQLLASSLGLASSAAQMLGMSEDSLQQSMLKVQQAMQAVQALTVIQNSLQRQSNIMKGIAIIQSKAQTAAQRLEAAAATQATGATVAQTVAMKAFNVVAKANPYVLLATSILAVIGLIVGYTSATKEATAADEAAKKAADLRRDSMDNMAQSFGNSAGEMIAKYKIMREQWNALGDDLAAKRKYLEQHRSDITNIAQAADGAKASVKGVGDVENLFARNTPSVVNAIRRRAEAMAYYAEYIRLTQLKLQELERASNYTYRNFHAGEKVISSELDAAGVGYDRGLLGTIAGAVNGGPMVVTIDEEQARKLTDWSRQSNLDSAMKSMENITKRFDDRLEKVWQGFEKAGGLEPASFAGGGTVGGSSSSGKTTGKTESRETVKTYEELRKEIDKILLESYKKEKEYSDEWLKNKRDEVQKQAEMEQAANAERERKLKAELDKSKAAGKIDEAQYQEGLNQIRNASAIIHLNIEERKDAELRRLDEEFAAKKVESIADQAAGEQAVRDAAYQDAVTKLYQEYVLRVETARKTGEDIEKINEEFDRRKLALDNDYANQTVEAQMAALNLELSTENLGEKEREELQRKLTAATAELAQQRAEQEKKAAEDALEADKESTEKRRKNLEEWVRRAGEAISKIGDFMTAMYDGQISKIEELLEQEQERYDQEVAQIEWLAERGAITSEEAEIRKRDALAATQKKQEELEKKKAAIEYKKAVLQKVNTISQIGIATALGIMQAHATVPWPASIAVAAFVAAMGALQTATALAQPIKAYKEGTKGKPHPGGLAIVGDGGKAEVIRYGGRSWLTPESPTLVDLPRGAEVIPDVTRSDLAALGESMRMTIPRDGATGQPVIINDYQALETRMAANTKAVTKELRGFRGDMRRQMSRQRLDQLMRNRL